MNDFLNNLKNILEKNNIDNKPVLVIGNSPNVLEKELGGEIDNKFFIIRFNKGNEINIDYEKYVGLKTNLKVYCSHYFKKKIYINMNNNDYSENIFVIPFGKNNKLKNKRKLKNLNYLILNNKVKNSFINEELKLNLKIKKNSSSSGLLICYYLLKIVDKIYIYGFSHNSRHYYNKNKSNNHDFHFEKKIFEYYEKENKIFKL